MSKLKAKLDKKMNGEVISFMKNFIQSLIRQRLQVVHWGWWSTGQTGKYGLSIYWNNLDEVQDEEG